MKGHAWIVHLNKRIQCAKKRVSYWKTKSPSNTQKSRGLGSEMAKADVEQLKHLKKRAIEELEKGKL